MSAPEDERPKSQSGSPTSDERIGLTAGVAAYVIWGAFPIFFHSLEPTSALEILAHRIVWTGVFLAIVLQITGRWGWVGELRADPAKLRRAWLAGLLISINWLTYVWAVGADRVLDASLGYFINPLLSVVLGVALLGEGIRRLQVLALTIGAVAVVVLSVGYGEFPIVGIVLALSFGFYGYLKKGMELDGLASLAAETSIVWPIAVIGLAVAFATGSSTFGHDNVGLNLRLLAAGPITAIPLALFGVAAPRLTLVTVGILQYITPMAQFFLGWWVFHEEMPPERLAGFALVWLALVIVTADAVATIRRNRSVRPDAAATSARGEGRAPARR